jgi:uncharacterized membrane protein
MAASWAIKAPCRDDSHWDGRQYTQLCYTDLVPLWSSRHLSASRPYIDGLFEYPVLAGGIASVAAAGTKNAGEFFDRLAGFQIAAALLSTIGMVVALGGPSLRVFLFTLAPSLVLYAFANFDLLACVGVAWGFAFLRRRHWALAGVAFGIGAGVKFFPAFLAIGATAALFGGKRWEDGLKLGAAAASAWILVNLPLMMLTPSGWWETYKFQLFREPDWGSIWYWLHRHRGVAWDTANRLADWCGTLGLGGAFVGILVLARRRSFTPEAGAALLMTTLLAFNKLWSLQYTLWVVPLMLLFDGSLWWFVAISCVDVAANVSEFRWFGGPSGANNLGGWATVFEAAVWARFAVVAAFGASLFRSGAALATANGPKRRTGRSPLAVWREAAAAMRAEVALGGRPPLPHYLRLAAEIGICGALVATAGMLAHGALGEFMGWAP